MSCFADRTSFHRDCRQTLAPGALVRTHRRWPGGVHRALVRRVFERGGERWVEVAGKDYLPSELLVLRPALSR